MKNAANPLDLKEENAQLKDLLSTKEARIQTQSQHIQQLEEYIINLRHQQYGASSEVNPQQAGLFDEAEELEEADIINESDRVTVASHTRKPKPRVSIPADLPREELVHDLADADKVCPNSACEGHALNAIGADTSEQLDIIPAQVKVLRHVRKKYACPCCEQYVVTASKPKQPIEKSIAAPGLLAHVALSKYADGLPLYRQTQMFKRWGAELNRTNLANWMVACGHLVQPLINLLQDKLHEQPVIHMDETPVQVLNEAGKKAQSKSYMWVQASTYTSTSPVVLFHYAPTRSSAVPLALLGDYPGALAVDGYEGYHAVCDKNTLTRSGCWAHVRRKFKDAQRVQPKGKAGKADQALAFIRKLYAIERAIKDQPPDKGYEARQQQAKPILNKLHQWLERALPRTPPKTAMGKALGYLHAQWPRLVVYLEDGRYPIDNNRAENAIRPFVIGRKNWLFSASTKGATASANLYSLIETAKANDLDLYDYMKAVFTDLPNANTLEDIEALLPWRQKVAHTKQNHIIKTKKRGSGEGSSLHGSA